MCEVLLPDGTPHPSNSRATIPDDPDTWFGFEQEYFLYQDGAPLGFPAGGGFPPPQGEYYTGVGYKNVGAIAREIVDTHLDLCLEAGIDHEGINAEVAKGQWEFQIFGKGSKRAADEMWIARYLLLRLCETYGVDVNFHPQAARNGLRLERLRHAHELLDRYLREVGGQEYFEALMAAFDTYKNEHIDVYGPDNHLRLTGLHETQSIDTVQLRPRGPRRVGPRPAQLREQRLPGVPGRPPPELAQRPVQGRGTHPGDDQHGPDRDLRRRARRGAVRRA